MSKLIPQTFERWRERPKDEVCWYEVPVMIDGLHKNLLEKAVPEMSKALIEALFQSGAGFGNPNVEKWNDIIRHCIIINADVKVPYTFLPEQYLYMAYKNWQKEYDEKLKWENKPLWGYVKYWLNRKIGSIKWIDHLRQIV